MNIHTAYGHDDTTKPQTEVAVTSLRLRTASADICNYTCTD